MNNKIPPPIVTLIFGLCIYFSRPFFPEFSSPLLISLSVISFVVGISVFVAAVSSFKKQKTTVNPISIDTASSLVISGIFKYSRNPMYLGMLLIIISFALYKASIISLILIPLFIFYINKFQIEPEEFEMRKKFGKEYEDYCKKVDRWI